MIKETVRKKKKFFLWATGGIGVILIILFALYFLVPKLIGMRSLREKIIAGISQKIAGTLDFQKVEVSLFPRPQIVIDRAKFAFAGTADGTIRSLEIYPQILPLLTGKVRIARVQLDGPNVSIIVPEKKTPLSVEEIEKKISGLLNTLSAKTPNTRIAIEKGSINISYPSRPIFSFRDLYGQIVLPPGEASIVLTCSSNVSRNISLDIRLDPKDFKGLGTIRLGGMKPQLIIDYLFEDAAGRLGDSEGNLVLSFKMPGFKGLQAEVQGSLPYLTFLNKKENIVLKGIGISGAVTLTGGRNEITLSELKLEYPLLTLSGSLNFNKTAQNVILQLDGRGVDVPSLRRVAFSLAGEVPIVQDIFGYVRGGTVPFISVRSAGASLEDIGKTENIYIEGRMERGEIYVLGPKLNFNEVNGDCVISKGILTGKNLAATIGNSRIRDGKLMVGLEGSDPLLHIDADVKADLTQTRNIMRRLIKNEPFLKELDLIDTICGEARGRVILGERTSSISPHIYLSDVSFTAEYQRLPFPLTIKGGQFSYDGMRVGVKNLGGRMGGSSFADLTGELRLGDTPFIEIPSGKMRIDQDEVYPWLNSFEGLKESLSDVRSLRGTVDLDTLNLKGPLLKPKEWHFMAAGKMEEVDIDWSFLPGPAHLKRGSIYASEEKISLSDAGVDMLDASVILSVTREGYLRGRPKTDLTYRGKMGPESRRWGAELADLPAQISLRDPITFEHAHFALKDGSTLFQGSWRIEGGPAITADVSKSSEELVISKLTIKDASSDAVLSADLQEKELKLAFAGKLSSETLQRVVTEEELPGGWIEGDFRVEIQKEKPFRVAVQGKLRVENISVSLRQGVPLKIDSLSMDGDGTRLTVKSAALMVDDNPFSLWGGLKYIPENLMVDVDISTDRIEWAKIAKTIDKLGRRENKKADDTWDLPVEGTVRLKSNSFAYDKYAWMPFQAEVAVHSNDLDIMVKRAILCGISSPGRVNVKPGGLSFDIQLIAEDEEMKYAFTCLLGMEHEVTGKFDLKGNLKAQGEKKINLDSLQGNLKLVAKDGRVYRAPFVLKILDFLDLTQIFRGLPEMRKEGIAYDSIKVQGELDHGLLEVKGGTLDGPSLKMAAEGSADLKNEKLNMTVLVSPMKKIDYIIGKIPIVGHILGGSILSVPVDVTGDLNDPQVSFHPASAVGSGLVGLIKRIITAPVRLFDAFLPAEKK